MIAVILVCCGIAYSLLAIAGALKFQRPLNLPDFQPPVSILKPVNGRDPHFYQAIRSHATQNYPDFEILFGIADPDDPARGDIERLQLEFPSLDIRIIHTASDAPNRKVGSLEILASQAIHAIFLVNDGDIRVEPDYLRRVVGHLADRETGLVTCLYRGRADSIPSKAEALGIATEFAPGVMVARLLSSSGFALGSTMAFRREDLDGIGGFRAIRDYLADDYQLGARMAGINKRVVVADAVVETNLGSGTWKSVWRHQLRWSRTIRVSRPAGYLGYVVTHLTAWSLAAALMGYRGTAAAGIAVRLISAAVALRALKLSLGALPAVPARDLFGAAVWAAALFGKTVEWRGTRYRLSRDGRIAPADG